MRRTKPNFFHEIYNQPYDYDSRLRLTSSCKASLQLIQRMSLLERLKVHNGCVNSICWNNTGELILSGSDDQHLVLTNVYNYKVLTDYKTSHRANIFSAKFLPNNGDHRIVSCSGDGIILYTDLLRTSDTFHNQFNCHNGTAYEIATVPGEPHTFFSCGEDCTVRYFDLRVKSSCNTPRCKEDILILRSKAITAMSINPTKPHYLAIGCSDSSVAIYDRRMLTIGEQTWSDDNDGSWTRPLSMFTVPEFEGHPYRITSLCYSPDGNDVLVSYSSDHIYLFSEKTQTAAPLKKLSTCLVEKSKSKRQPPMRSPPPVRRLRLRGDWSDTGPDARPEREGGRRNGAEIAQARPMLQTSLMQRMTDVLSRMLNDPATRAALSGDNEETFQGVIDQHAEAQQHADESNEIIHEERINDVQLMDAETNTENNDNNVGLQAEVEINLDADNIEGSIENRHEESEANTNSLNEYVENDECRDITVGNNESSQSEMSIVESTISPNLSRDNKNENDVMNNNNDANDMPTNMENARDETMMENLQDRLASMRDGFLEKHGSEPAVSLTYSDKSSTGATISLGVADEVTRDSYHPGPSGCQNLSGVKIGAARPSSSRTIGSVYDDVCESVDIYTDSDDDEVETSSKRIKNPIETEMDEAVMNARESLGQNESFGENTNTEFHVRQRYMGHRNASAEQKKSHNVDEGLLASAPNPYYSDRLSFPGFDSSFFRTMIKEANFWGNDFVMSGSDCGHVFVWERETAKLCMILEADQHVVNCLQPHPFLPMLATSGIDYDVKLWAPINEEASFDTNFAEDLQKRNAVMLEETKDTITVPAVFMIRMLACLNQIRRGRGRNRRRSGNETDELRGG